MKHYNTDNRFSDRKNKTNKCLIAAKSKVFYHGPSPAHVL